MGAQIDRIMTMLELLAGDVLESLEDVPEDVLNKAIVIPEANSLFGLATHLKFAGQQLTLVAVDGRDIARNREAEFVSTGTFAELKDGYDWWISEAHQLLDGMSDDELGRDLGSPPYRQGLNVESMTVGDVLIHAVDHTALHLGHIQVTKQFLPYAESVTARSSNWVW